MIVLNGGYNKDFMPITELILCCYITPKNIVEPEFVHIFNIEELQQYGYLHQRYFTPVSHKRWMKCLGLH